MKILHTLQELRSYRESLDGSVGFVPTMGALHQGHITLFQASQKACDHTIVSIFVNPTQFLAHEDLDKYPRQEAKDLAILERLGIDALFLPTIETMYAPDEPKVLAPNLRSYTLEGAIRPGHFDGVLTVVLKLFNLTRPTHAFFGKKDAQQLVLITHMVERLFLPITIVPIDTMREQDGLALSSRNVYLLPQERQMALSISKSLVLASQMVGAGKVECAVLEKAMREVLQTLEVEYIAFVDRAFNPLQTIEVKNSIIAIACRVGKTRLIDNVWL
ncbi:MAG: pantoate--beta-alanine ligase [Sulfuricurvum sp. PC08-66]|nr:MAG: pantoate--beta-alanine ligase [Sulfuricurvum sp. PC08-66]